MLENLRGQLVRGRRLMTEGMPRRNVATARGIVVRGHGVASGQSGDPRFPQGTIALQLPIFREKGVDLTSILGAEPRPGTINVDISPRVLTILMHQIVLSDITWSQAMPVECFFLFEAKLRHDNHLINAMIYLPDPATKIYHLQRPEVVEVIAADVPHLGYGDSVELEVDSTFLCFGIDAPTPLN